MIGQKSILLLNYIALNSVPQTSNLRVKCNHDFNYLILGIIPMAERTKMNKINPLCLKETLERECTFLHLCQWPTFLYKFSSLLWIMHLWRMILGEWYIYLWPVSDQLPVLPLTLHDSSPRPYYYMVLRKIILLCGLEKDHNISMSFILIIGEKYENY